MPNATNESRPVRILPAGEEAIAAAAALVAAGEPVAVPTETVYGLAADARNADAVARVYAAKGRPAFNPLIIHVADLAAAEKIARFDTIALLLAERFWPGPLTLVLPRRADAGIASIATAGLDSVALRVPAHPVMRALLRACDCPLAAPSANVSGGVSPTRAAHVAASLGDRLQMVIDGGRCERGIESTIVRTGSGGVAVLRPGPVTREMLAQATGLPVALACENTTASVSAPGQLARHYAPGKPLRLDAKSARDDEYMIGFGAIEGDVSLSGDGDMIVAAACLFDALHAAAASERPRIAVAPIPPEGIGGAINDRLKRAAAP